MRDNGDDGCDHLLINFKILLLFKIITLPHFQII